MVWIVVVEGLSAWRIGMTVGKVVVTQECLEVDCWVLGQTAVEEAVGAGGTELGGQSWDEGRSRSGAGELASEARRSARDFEHGERTGN